MKSSKAIAKTKTRAKARPKRSKLIIAGLIIGPTLVVLIVSFGLYYWSYQNKILPHLRVGGVSVGSRSAAAAREIIETKARPMREGKIMVVIGNKTFEETTANLGIDFNLDQTLAAAAHIGHTNRFSTDLWHHLRQLFHKTDITPVTTEYRQQLSDWTRNIAARVDEPPQEANLEVKNGQASIIEPKSGMQIDQKSINQSLNRQILTFQTPTLTTAKAATEARITKTQAEALAPAAIDLVKAPIKLLIANQSFTISSNSLGKWIQLKTADNIKPAYSGSWPVALAADTVANPYVSFNTEKIKSYLDDISPKVNIDPKDAKFTFADGKVTVYRPSSPGQVLNATTAAGIIVKTLEDKNASRELKIELEAKKPTLDESVANNISQYGIKELVGTATTSFTRSPQNRIHNIKNGASYLNGIIIKPGEEFSTISYLGKIDGSTGYLPELVIKEDKTTPEFGGGLCQVSTTLFRAAMNAGLKITERRNHSYRVSYYEPPVGMDATIYSPKPDLKFINNTPAHILVQSSVEGTRITFNFYGTSDGRRVEISQPNMFDVTEPGEPIYTVDPAMAPGEVKQTEKPHAGAKASFTYKVFSREGNAVVDQKFTSSYIPWPARFVKGPDAPPPPAEPPPAEAPATPPPA